MTTNKQLPMGKHVQHNADTDQYDLYYNRQLLGSRANERDAKNALDERVYDLERSGMMYTAAMLDADSSVEEIATDTVVTVTTWRQYSSFYAGCDLTEVMVGPHSGNGDKAGVELVIGGTCINMCESEVITMADVQAIRDNLTALLNDARLWAAYRAVAV